MFFLLVGRPVGSIPHTPTEVVLGFVHVFLCCFNGFLCLRSIVFLGCFRRFLKLLERFSFVLQCSFLLLGAPVGSIPHTPTKVVLGFVHVFLGCFNGFLFVFQLFSWVFPSISKTVERFIFCFAMFFLLVGRPCRIDTPYTQKSRFGLRPRFSWLFQWFSLFFSIVFLCVFPSISKTVERFLCFAMFFFWLGAQTDRYPIHPQKSFWASSTFSLLWAMPCRIDTPHTHKSRFGLRPRFSWLLQWFSLFFQLFSWGVFPSISKTVERFSFVSQCSFFDWALLSDRYPIHPQKSFWASSTFFLVVSMVFFVCSIVFLGAIRRFLKQLNDFLLFCNVIFLVGRPCRIDTPYTHKSRFGLRPRFSWLFQLFSLFFQLFSWVFPSISKIVERFSFVLQCSFFGWAPLSDRYPILPHTPTKVVLGFVHVFLGCFNGFLCFFNCFPGCIPSISKTVERFSFVLQCSFFGWAPLSDRYPIHPQKSFWASSTFFLFVSMVFFVLFNCFPGCFRRFPKQLNDFLLFCNVLFLVGRPWRIDTPYTQKSRFGLCVHVFLGCFNGFLCLCSIVSLGVSVDF